MAIALAGPADYQTTAYSKFAAVAIIRRAFQEHTRGTWLYEEPIQRLASELRSIREDCSTEGWDGYSARPVTSKSIDMALSAASLLPYYCPQPELAPEADGEISFEWYKGPKHVFTFSIGENKVISYAGVIGNERFHGRVEFIGSLPTIVFSSIATLYGISLPAILSK